MSSVWHWDRRGHAACGSGVLDLLTQAPDVLAERGDHVCKECLRRFNVDPQRSAAARRGAATRSWRRAYADALAALLPRRVVQCVDCGAVRAWRGFLRAFLDGWTWRLARPVLSWRCGICSAIEAGDVLELAGAALDERMRREELRPPKEG